MKVALDIRKSVEENAAHYFELAKKSKKKFEGAKKAILDHKLKLAQEPPHKPVISKAPLSRARRHEWFTKFRWFVSSDGYLVIGGRDAATNDIIIKKHANPEDLVFHTDMAGSPFTVVKNKLAGAEKIPQATLDEAAAFTAAHSRAWKQGMSTLPVFSALPSQFSKTPNPGEFISKGSFIVRGKLTYYSPKMNYAIGIYDGLVMGGPDSAVAKNCLLKISLSQGSEKASDAAKYVAKILGAEVDEVLRVLPQGIKIVKDQSKY